jgi:hypothetical protein
VLNPELYHALGAAFSTTPSISNEDVPGEYKRPKVSIHKKHERIWMEVLSWGEVYHVNCPVCNDHRERLYFSHLWGTACVIEGTKRNGYFGKRLHYCQNEQCNLKGWASRIKVPADLVLTGEPVAVKEGGRYIEPAEISLPKQVLPLTSEDVPQDVLLYLWSRNFDPAFLDETYGIKYAPEGAMLGEHELFEDRLLIPITRGKKLVAWQTRRLDDRPKDRFKYITMPGFKKNEGLYNMDNAWKHLDVVLCEGVTDVWRIGPQAMALFGKTLSPKQLDILNLMWKPWNATCVVALDSDATDNARIISRRLEKSGAFRKVRPLILKEGDPGGYSTEEINALIQEAIND